MEDSKKSSAEDAAQDNDCTERIPRQNSGKLDLESSLGASFVSENSNSAENLSGSPGKNCDGNLLHQPTLPREEQTADKPTNNNNSGALVDKLEDRATLQENGSPPARNASHRFQHWLKSSISPDPPPHSSSQAGKEEDRLSDVSEEESDISEGECLRELFMPGELHTPILGYETMEARSRFTVYKIFVEKTTSEVAPTSWFVFRRYSDFLHLNDKLRMVFPAFQLSLPPKRWIRDNFDKEFLDSRRLGLQLFLDNITGHRDICNSEPVRDFFCTDDPPGPHDSLEESRALCDLLEESLYNLRQDLQEKNAELDVVQEELGLYKSQVKLLTKQLRMLTSQKNGGGITSSASASASCSVDDLEQASSPVPDSGYGF
ncbi:hypothetical protein ACOMHN_020190 [Nucella lapillus]